MPDFSVRSSEPEILDNFELEGNELSENLRELATVNRLLGGYRNVRQGLEQYLRNHPAQKTIRIIDIGCGGGDTLQYLADYGLKKNLQLELTGVDANPKAVEFARRETSGYSNIVFQQVDILAPEFENLEADLVMFNLVLHHFSDAEIIKILNTCQKMNAAILINDLQRSKWAYQLFRIASKIGGFSYISRHDGLLSIRKSFCKNDWLRLLANSGIKEFNINWRWAFRYVVLVSSLTPPNEED